MVRSWTAPATRSCSSPAASWASACPSTRPSWTPPAQPAWPCSPTRASSAAPRLTVPRPRPPGHRGDHPQLRPAARPATQRFYSDSYLYGLADTLKSGRPDGNAGDGKVASATRADFAAAITVLTEDGHQGNVYELSGDTAWTFHDLAAEISRQSATPVTYNNVARAERRTALIEVGLPEEIADLLVDIDIDNAIDRGLLAGTFADLSRLIGRSTAPITETIASELKAL